MKSYLKVGTHPVTKTRESGSVAAGDMISGYPINDAYQGAGTASDNTRLYPSPYSSDCFLDRELSWIEFNRRVLSMASDAAIPLLERVKFLAITCANIDEFYMKRMGGLKLMQLNRCTRAVSEQRATETQLEQCRSRLRSLQKEKEAVFDVVLEQLKKHEIELCSFSALYPAEREALQDFYASSIRPLLNPLAIDQSHPFPSVSNLSLNLLIYFKRHGCSDTLCAQLTVPVGNGISRFVRVGKGHKYILIEDLIIQQMDNLFPQAQIISCDVFRVTRNAITESSQTGITDVLETIKSELHNRKFAPVVRLQTGANMAEMQKLILLKHLGLEEKDDVFECSSILRLSDLMEIASLDIPALHDKPHRPIDNITIGKSNTILSSIRSAGSILLQHPYESFASSVERFVEETCQDPLVMSIKMTIYRTSADTRILGKLIEAAQAGKQVTVIVELKARFDEEANIRWAKRLQQAGVHVIYGVANLKTHCKTILVVRKDKECLRRYAHVGTGNYHAGTARLYSDLGLLTCDDQITSDLGELFDYLTTGCHSQRPFLRVMAGPHAIKASLLGKIKREITGHSGNSPGLIRLKTNALEDPDIIAALYEASRAGVKVELIVRDICRLRPGVAGMSENIHVVSIVGRFLEHSRIYYFHNNGDEELYMGSADLMTRNLERRVELLIPIDSPNAKSALKQILEEQISDSGCAWEMQSDGQYKKRLSIDKAPSLNCHEMSIRNAQQRLCGTQQQLKPVPRKLATQWLRVCF